MADLTLVPIKEAYVGSTLVYSYDNTPPNITVTTPASSSSSSPTYTTGGATYRVSGNVTDLESGVKAVYVNGNNAIVSGNTWYCDVTLTANTTTTISVYAIDNAKNQSATIKRYVNYDNSNPTLSVSAPTSTSSSSPTYVQSDSSYSYTVKGTVSDAAGIKSVTVNGTAVTISSGSWSRVMSLATNTTHTITVVATDNAGRTTTAKRYVRIEAYYQQAARTAGAAVQSSLDATLKNSTVCNAIAGNSTAYGIMKSKYSSSMTSYIDSNWNIGLNYLNFKCKLKTYLYKTGNECTSITGGWTAKSNGTDNNSNDNTKKFSTYIMLRGFTPGSFACTNNKINFTGFKSLVSVNMKYGHTPGSYGYVGTTTKLGTTSSRNTLTYVNAATKTTPSKDESQYTATFTIAPSQSSYYAQISGNGSTLNGMSSGDDVYIYNVYITP